MYETFFGFRSRPFSLTPDPRFLYQSRQHAMALTMLEYGLESQAPVLLLSGEVGSGKTTLVRHLLAGLGDRVCVGTLSNTHPRQQSVLEWVAAAYGLAVAGLTEIQVHAAFNRAVAHEFNGGRRTLLVVDEAQNLRPEVLEELRLLSNVNVDEQLALQILLVGQPEVREVLASPALRQLAQRIAADHHLRPLDRADTAAYIRHRLQVAGGDPDTFEDAAATLVHVRTGGVPRLINQLCDYALVYAYSSRRGRIDAELVAQVLQDRAAWGSLPIFTATAEPAQAQPVP